MKSIGFKARPAVAVLLSCLFVIGPKRAPAYASPPLSLGLNLSLSCPNGNPMWLPSTIHPPISGVVARFVSAASAQQRIVSTELRTGGAIDPAYVHNQRVFLQIAPGRQILVLVPNGMVLRVGQEVSFIPSHADPDNLCYYVPNLIIP